MHLTRLTPTTTTLSTVHSYLEPSLLRVKVQHRVACATTTNLNGFMSSQCPITHAEVKRILEAPIFNTIDLINQISLQDETSFESVPVEPLRHKVAFRVDSTTPAQTTTPSSRTRLSTRRPKGRQRTFSRIPRKTPCRTPILATTTNPT